MNRSQSRFLIAPVGAILVALCCTATTAAPITFIYTGNGSGTIGSTSFSNAAYVVTGYGDTSGRDQPEVDVYDIQHSSATIEIDGVGLFNFTTPTRTFLAFSFPLAGFSRPPSEGGLDLIFAPTDPSLATWDMLTSIGPIFGASTLLQWGFETIPQTDGGELQFLGGNPEGSFQAVVVPEPSSIALVMMGAIALIGGRLAQRRKRQA